MGDRRHKCSNKGASGLTPRQDILMKEIMLNPLLNCKDIAEKLGMTFSSVQSAVRKPEFVAELERRKAQLRDSMMYHLEKGYESIAKRGLEVIEAKLSKDVEFISDNLALRSVEIGGKALGIGQDKVIVNQVPEGYLESLASRLVELQRKTTGVTYNGEATEIQESREN